MMNKRGNVPLEEVIFVLVNLVFFSMLFFFVYNTSHSIFLTERLYAKEIALSIDSAKPGTQINIDISDLYKVASKNNFDINNAFYFKDNKIIQFIFQIAWSWYIVIGTILTFGMAFIFGGFSKSCDANRQ